MPLKSKSEELKLITIVLFFCLLVVGFAYAGQRRLWGDEASSIFSARTFSTKQILLGQMKGEANNCPLFFLILKPFSYLLDKPIKDDRDDFQKRIVLRVTGVVSVSLFMSLIFYYFSNRYSLIWGACALLLALSIHPIWNYWAECRAYPLWILLTGIQTLLFLEIWRQGYKKKLWLWLTVVNIAMAFTAVFSVLTTLAVSVLLWLGITKRWKRYIGLTLVPPAVAIFYVKQFQMAPGYSLILFPESVWHVIMANFNKERVLLFMLVMAVGCIFLYRQKRGRLEQKKAAILKESIPFFSFMFVTLILTSLLLLYLQWRSTTGIPRSVMQFRYIIFVTPIAIIATTFCIYFLWNMVKDKRWLAVVFVAFVVGLLLYRALITYQRVAL